jgi:hypothetical protein
LTDGGGASDGSFPGAPCVGGAGASDSARGAAAGAAGAGRAGAGRAAGLAATTGAASNGRSPYGGSGDEGDAGASHDGKFRGAALSSSPSP